MSLYSLRLADPTRSELVDRDRRFADLYPIMLLYLYAATLRGHIR